MAILEPKQARISTVVDVSATDGTMPTTLAVWTALQVENTWDRDVVGTPFLKPANAGDPIGATGTRISKGWFTDLSVSNITLTGNTITTISGDLNLNSFSDDIFMEDVIATTLTCPLISGGTGSGAILDLQSTTNVTKGTVRIRDGSDFLFDDGGLFEVSPNKDAKVAIGRSMISSPTTDIAYWSHYDNGDSNTDYAIKQLASGRTCLNAKAATQVDICINNAIKASMSSAGVFSISAAGAFQLPTGTTVNEIITSVSSSSTDDQVPTGKAVYDAILAGDQVSPPSGPTDTGTAGEWAYGSGYAYRCVATDTWVRNVVSTSW